MAVATTHDAITLGVVQDHQLIGIFLAHAHGRARARALQDSANRHPTIAVVERSMQAESLPILPFVAFRRVWA